VIRAVAIDSAVKVALLSRFLFEEPDPFIDYLNTLRRLNQNGGRN
jgi:hypothetical protein